MGCAFVCHAPLRKHISRSIAMTISVPALNRATKPHRGKARFPANTVGQEERRIQSLRLVLIFLFAAAQSGCWEGVTRETLATVLSVEGSATISMDGGQTFSPLLPGAHAGKRNLIQTSASSRVSIALLPNILLQLEPDTGLEIGRIAMTKDGNETGDAIRGRYARVKLLGGRIVASHVWGEANAEFSVASSQGELVAKSNCLFSLQSDEHATRLTCVSGTVRFRPHDGAASTTVRGGFLGEWPSPTPGLIAAETDARGQEDLQEALEVEQKLRRLMRKTP